MSLANPLEGSSPVNFSALAKSKPYTPSSGVTSALTSSGYTKKPSFASTASGVNQSPAPPGQPGAQADPAALSPFDPAADPIVQQIRALGQRNVHLAEDATLAGKKEELIGYGYDKNLARLYPDQGTADAAKQNPFSFLANAEHDYGQRTNTLEDSLNKQNLFYSSARGNQLGENARGYQEQLAGGASSLQRALGALDAALLNARQGAAADDLGAQQQAFNDYRPSETSAQQPPSITDLLVPSTEALPMYAGNPLDDQLLAELARPYNRRAR